METGVACQTENTELCDAETQTEKGLTVSFTNKGAFGAEEGKFVSERY